MHEILLGEFFFTGEGGASLEALERKVMLVVYLQKSWINKNQSPLVA